MPTTIFAVTNRGLETVSAAELAELPGVQVRAVDYRRVTAAVVGSLTPLLGLRTVDDVFLDLATWEGIPPQRAGLAVLAERSQTLPLVTALEQVASVRRVHLRPSFSVTANFVGKRKYTMDEIKATVGEAIAARHGWEYTTEDASEINLRVFLEHETAYIGVRLGDTALHRRHYKQAHRSGSLKPSVAAAMLRVAGITPDSPEWLVLDPFCGAGTIPIEAAITGADVLCGDIDPAALQAARENAKWARLRLPFQCWDAQRLPLPSGSVERVVTNPPWGQQVQVDAALAAFYRKFCAELGRVLEPGGTIVLLTSLPELVRIPGLRQTEKIEISLFGMNPFILRWQA